MTVPVLGGAPTKLSPTLIDKISGYVRQGNYIETSCVACDITKEAYYTYLERAKASQEKIERGESLTDTEILCIAFAYSVKKARADAEIDLLSKLSGAPINDWTRYAWILERTRPEQFALRNKTDIGLDVESIKKLFTELDANRRKHLITIREVEPVMLSEATKES